MGTAEDLPKVTMETELESRWSEYQVILFSPHVLLPVSGFLLLKRK